MQLRLDNRPGNVQRTSRLLTALLMLAVLPLWPIPSIAGVEAILTDEAYTSSSNPAKKFEKKKGLLVSRSQRSFLKDAVLEEVGRVLMIPSPYPLLEGEGRKAGGSLGGRIKETEPFSQREADKT
jgi:hypothetical protein